MKDLLRLPVHALHKVPKSNLMCAFCCAGCPEGGGSQHHSLHSKQPQHLCLSCGGSAPECDSQRHRDQSGTHRSRCALHCCRRASACLCLATQSLQHCLRRMHKHSKQQQLQHQTYAHMNPLGAGRACSLPEWECQPVLWPSAGHPSSMAAARLGLGACSAQAGRQPGSGARVLSRRLCRQQPVLLGRHHCWRPQAHGFHRRAASRGSSCSAQLQACACGCSCCQPSCANRGSHEKTT